MAERRWRRAAAAATLALLLAPCATGPAAAQGVTQAQLRALAERAVDDPRALAQLRAVRRVDGHPVDLGQALSGAEGPALLSRLRALTAGGAPGSAVVASDARDEAEAILDGRRFKPSRVPRPLSGVLRRLGRWLQPVAEPVRELWARLPRTVGAQLAVVATVFAIAVVITARLVGRRSPHALLRSTGHRQGAEGLDPDDLEREATAAERAGDLDRAVRLRFVAGLLRLDLAGVIPYRSSLTTGQLRARLRSQSFAGLAAAFDEIAYGGRPAEESDVERARSGWPRVLAEARR